MTSEGRLDQTILEPYVREKANEALASATRISAVFGGVCVLMLGALIGAGLARDLWVPLVMASVACVYSLAVNMVARRQRLYGWVSYAVLLPFISVPTVAYLAAAVLLPEGAATFITGPISYLFIFLVVITGFMFEKRLAWVAGAVAALEYLGCYLLARPHLEELVVADAAMRQDLVAAPIYVVKAAMMAGSGFLVGSLASSARGLVAKVLLEEREKQGISRLFGQFVSPEVKERIIKEKSGTLGERKDVVVLFSDLRGFSTYSERSDPAALVKHLNEYFDGMVAAITANGGVIDKFIGDAVMAVFGGVLDLPRPAEAALDAAKAMRAKLKAMNERWAREGVQVLDNGIGLHFGPVLQGTLGSSERKEFTVIGDAVNTASRLESATKEHGFPTLVSAAFVDALPAARRAECVRVGAVKLKGKSQEVEVFGVPD
jgi:class 3 adenylate cyclase